MRVTKGMKATGRRTMRMTRKRAKGEASFEYQACFSMARAARSVGGTCHSSTYGTVRRVSASLRRQRKRTPEIARLAPTRDRLLVRLGAGLADLALEEVEHDGGHLPENVDPGRVGLDGDAEEGGVLGVLRQLDSLRKVLDEEAGWHKGERKLRPRDSRRDCSERLTQTAQTRAPFLVASRHCCQMGTWSFGSVSSLYRPMTR
jgi:hypothetical protein